MNELEQKLKEHSDSETPDFGKIADIILNKTILCTKKNRYRICEIEFYLKDEVHQDLYTHLSKDQLSFGNLYFHKFKNGGYKEGTYKCFDLTMGNEGNQRYFGVLVRSICNIKQNNFIEGPCRSLTRLFQDYEVSSVKQFMSGENDLRMFNQDGRIWICDDKSLALEDIWRGERIGLSDKYPEFKKRLYRYLVMPKKIKKGKSSLQKIAKYE